MFNPLVWQALVFLHTHKIGHPFTNHYTTTYYFPTTFILCVNWQSGKATFTSTSDIPLSVQLHTICNLLLSSTAIWDRKEKYSENKKETCLRKPFFNTFTGKRVSACCLSTVRVSSSLSKIQSKQCNNLFLTIKVLAISTYYNTAAGILATG